MKKIFSRFQNKIYSNPLLFLIISLALLRLAMLGSYPLMDTTEARYADISQMMSARNDWITPWFRPDVPFWGKPPLAFWCTAFSFKLFGVNEFSARLPHWFMGIMAGWFVWDLGLRRSRREAIIAISLLSGCLIYYFSAGAVMTDMALTLGIVVSMWSFWLAVVPNKNAALRQRATWLFFLSLGWGLLAKGPLALALTALALFSWMFLTRSNWSSVRQLPWLRGLILMLLISVPWYWAAEQKTPGFLNYFLIGEHIKRFTVPGWKGDLYGNAHVHAHGTIWLYLLYMLAPWCILIPVFLFYRRNQFSLPTTLPIANSEVLAEIEWRKYLLCWGLAPAVFFTFAGNIVMPYVLPGIPALALLGSSYLLQFDEKLVDRMLTFGLKTILVGSLAFMSIFPFTGYGERKSERFLVNTYDRLRSQDSNLVYWDQYPFSAGFYSQDRVRSVFDLQQLKYQLELPNQLFLALGRGNSDILDSAEIRNRFELIGAFRRYSLYRELQIPHGG